MRHTVLMVTNNYQPYQGGVVQSVRASRAALRALGHDVVIATLDFIGSEAEEGVERLFSPVRFTYRTNQMAVAWCATQQLCALMKMLQPTIVHTHHPFLLGMAAYRAAQTMSLPVIFTHHTLYDRYLHYAPLPQWVTRPMITYRVAHYCHRVAGVIAPSLCVKHSIQEQYRVDHQQVFHIPSALYDFKQILEERRSKKPLELITVGRFTPEKKIDTLIDSLALLKKKYPALLWRMRIVGYGYLESELTRYAYEEAHLSTDQLLFIRAPSRADLHTLYAESDLFLFASQSETQGLVLAEALASALPIIAFRGPAVDEAVLQGVSGFLVDSCEELVDRIAFLASDTACYERFSRAARASADRYGLLHHGELLISVYNRIRAHKTAL
jgi:glycosyltransferase involved in cell wall biosynthesis